MTSLFLASSLYAMVLGAGTESYTDAHHETDTTGKPLVVMVSAVWCGPCQRMKTQVLPLVRRGGLFSRVAFAQVDVDREPELTQSLIGGGPIPQLVVFRKTSEGWKRRKLVGLQTPDQVEQFISEALVSDAPPAPKTDNGDHPAVPQQRPVSKATIKPVSTSTR